MVHMCCASNFVHFPRGNKSDQAEPMQSECVPSTSATAAAIPEVVSRPTCQRRKKMTMHEKLAREFHDQKMKYLKEEHEIKMKILQIELDMKLEAQAMNTAKYMNETVLLDS